MTGSGWAGSAVLRTAGLPIRLWLAGGSPELFALLRDLDRRETAYAELGRRAAERIGTDLVPSPDLTPADRRLALSVRRALHGGDVAAGAGARALAAVPAGGSLAVELTRVADRADELADLLTAAACLHDQEQQRLLAASYLAWQSTPAGARALADGTLPPSADLIARIGRGEQWTSKRMRRHSEYLWRMIARGAAKATPRGWLGHVCVCAVSDCASPLLLTTEAATDWTQNLHENATDSLAKDTRLGFAPLCRQPDGEHLQIFTIDPEHPDMLRPLRIKRTPLTDLTRRVLSQGALPLGDTEAAILPPGATEQQRTVLRGALTRLVELRVLQASVTADRRYTGWFPLGTGDRMTQRVDGGYLDVYRRGAGSLMAAEVARVTAAVGQLLRVHALIAIDAGHRPPRLPGVGEQPRPVLDVVNEQLAAQDAAARTRDGDAREVRRDQRNASWPEPRTEGSGYASLVGWLAAAARRPGETIDIDVGLLDRLGAPPATAGWPADCTLRPMAGGMWALDMIAPAGLLDARFAGTLERLHGPLPHIDAYRAFVRDLDEVTGIPSVELLFPALSAYAANAVRRPLYTSAWTGDPDLTAYTATGQRARYLPLSELTVRGDGDRIAVEASGNPIRPLYHSMRDAPPPWDTVANLLLRGSAQRLAWVRRLRHSLAALPALRSVPRITVAGSLVVSPRQWLVPAADRPDPGLPALDRARAVGRLRDGLGLPRWVFVSSGLGASRPLPCDLESLHAPGILDQVAASGPVVCEEMVPAPPDLVVTDHADPDRATVAAELLLRIPPDGDRAPSTADQERR